MKRTWMSVLSLVVLSPAWSSAADNRADFPLPSEGQNGYYPGNRDPLLPNPLIKLPLGAVEPTGWLRRMLILEADGMFGRLGELSQWCRKEGNAWLDPTGKGGRGWEELPYWLKGFTDLGFILKDQLIIAEARTWLDAAIKSQREDGYFGPEANRAAHDVWPNMPMLNALQSLYEATGDKRVLPFMARYFRWEMSLPLEQLLPGSWQKVRGGDNLQSVYWLYNRTGEAWLLDLAKRLHERTADWTAGIASWHGVNICQGYKEPAIFYQQSKDPKHLQAAERNYQEVMNKYGQMPGGMFGADENCRQGYSDPRQGAEACSMAELMLTDELLSGITGDPLFADRCEEIAFNSLPASMTPDLKALHYLTGANMVLLDQADKSPGVENSGCMLAYSPDERYRCCQHNVAHGWPYFSEHLWMATRDEGLAAVLYSPCEVEAKVRGGGKVRLREETAYPFGEKIEISVVSGAGKFPIYLRIPRWCENATLSVDGQPLPGTEAGKYFGVSQEWKAGDRLILELPMKVSVRTWKSNHGAVSVDRGPLTYSLQIGERWEKSGPERWPNWEVFPTTPWNYGLVLDPRDAAASFKVVKKEGALADQPFEPAAAPIKLLARGKRIPKWGMEFGLVATLQDSPARSEEPAEDITLIPMGCARLRISAFPVIGEGPDARTWTPPPPPPNASHVHDDIRALDDGILPKSSADTTIPRFTWWDLLGTTEWVGYKFPEPRKISRSEVYWFDDTGSGRCRVPASWRLLYLDGGEWKEVQGANRYGVARDAMNKVTFQPVTTSEVRLEAKLQEKMSAGILEWKVE